MKHPKTLTAWLADYVLFRSISDASTYQMRRTIGILGEWLQRDPLVTDLDDW